MKIYTGYNIGGYVEYRGYKPYLDPRGGDFIKKSNGREDILQEWVDFEDGKIKKEDFLGKYNFDYLIVKDDDLLYDYSNDNYKMIYENEEQKIKVYENNKN